MSERNKPAAKRRPSANRSITKGLAYVAALGIFVAANVSAARAQDQTGQMVDPNRIVMVINGEEIKGAEYYRRMEYLQGVGTRLGNSFSEFPPGFLTIQQMINERLAFALAKEKGIYPTDEEVDAEIKVRQGDNPKLLEDWLASGQSLDEFKYHLRVQIAQFKIQTFGITITDAEVEDHYKKSPDVYTIPKQLKLRMIAVTNPEDTKLVDQDIAAGKDFAAVAKERSVDVSKALGGEYGTVPEYELTTATRDALSTVKIGQTTKWLTTAKDGGEGTYLKFFLEDIIPPKKLELDAPLRRVIRRKLMVDKGRVKNTDITKELDALRAKAKVDIKQPEFADAYKKFLDVYFKQQGIKQ